MAVNIPTPNFSNAGASFSAGLSSGFNMGRGLREMMRQEEKDRREDEEYKEKQDLKAELRGIHTGAVEVEDNTEAIAGANREREERITGIRNSFAAKEDARKRDLESVASYLRDAATPNDSADTDIVDSRRAGELSAQAVIDSSAIPASSVRALAGDEAAAEAAHKERLASIGPAKRYGLLGTYKDTPFTPEEEGRIRAQAADRALAARGMKGGHEKEFSETVQLRLQDALRTTLTKLGKDYEGQNMDDPSVLMRYTGAQASAYRAAGQGEKADKLMGEAKSKLGMQAIFLAETDTAAANGVLKAMNPASPMQIVRYQKAKYPTDPDMLVIKGSDGKERTIPSDEFMAGVAMMHSDPKGVLDFLAKSKDRQHAAKLALIQLEAQKRVSAALDRLAL
jgi:hypothetical protein